MLTVETLYSHLYREEDEWSLFWGCLRYSPTQKSCLSSPRWSWDTWWMRGFICTHRASSTVASSYIRSWLDVSPYNWLWLWQLLLLIWPSELMTFVPKQNFLSSLLLSPGTVPILPSRVVWWSDLLGSSQHCLAAGCLSLFTEWP